jgi:NADPH:quinone reductase-like Zn-dependent oxidoreductase/NAD(P)-dependent dehydrogenase (short-subunit alcohol dehydrogenase family)
MTNPEHLIEPYISKLLPGLSGEISSEATSNQSPLLTENEWGEMLLETGFSGLDTCISDAGFITEDAVSAIMISQALAPPTTFETSIHVIYNDACTAQLELLQELSGPKPSARDLSIVPVSWNNIAEQNLVQSICIFLADLDGSLLGRLKEDDLDKLKGIISAAKAVVWVTFHTSDEAQSPAEGLVPGLVRTLATENEDCRVISVSLEASKAVSSAIDNVTKVLDSLLHAQDVPEDEYIEQNGLLHIPRVLEDRAMSTQIFSQEHTATKPWCELDNPHLTIGKIGRLNTLHFEQAVPSATALESDDLLVEVKAVGLSSRDLLVAQGQVHDDAFGSEFAGVVLQTGSSSAHDLKIGDRVFGVAKDAMSQTKRCKSFQVQKIPAIMDFCEAATYPIAFCTAYYSLVQCARIMEGDAILIHRGAEMVGQASIQIAQLNGCKVFVTVDRAEQATALEDMYDIPRSHMFSSHTIGFGDGIRRLTQGRGVDVVVNSLVGEAAQESWDCLAPFGRFIDIGETVSATSLPMGKSRMFVGVDIYELAQDASFRKVFSEVLQLIEDKKLTAPKPLHVFKQNEVGTAFKLLQSKEHTGRLAIEMADEETVEMVQAPNTKSLFDAECTYLLSGGFGGIGQGIARWMVQNGVRNLMIPSRKQVEGTGSAREEFVQELRANGADIRAPLCDIADKSQLEEMLRNARDMPPIKGCIQSAMVLKDSSFANMSIDDWHASLAPKLAGSWNLHQLLPSDLDFFVMFSSSTGIMGSFGQSNYTVGNTYQDALAAHRVQHGQRAHAIAMSMVVGVGWVAENAQIQALLRVRGMLEEVSLDDIYELLRFCCNPERPDVGAQIITPLSLPADLRALGIVAPLGSTRPLYSYLNTLPSRYDVSGDGVGGQESKKLPSFSLQDATTLMEATDIITEAIQTQLSSLLVVSKDDIDTKKPIHKYGVDSLVAVEMRNWFAKGVGADVGTVEILGEAGIAELAAKVAIRSRFVKEELKT